MGLMDSINAVAGNVIGTFCGSDRAEYYPGSGGSFSVQFIRFDPFTSDQLAGMSSVNENDSVWVLASEVWSPEVSDQIQFPDGTRWEVLAVEPHKQRGYFKLGLSQIQT